MYIPNTHSQEYSKLNELIASVPREDLIRLTTYLRRYIAPQVTYKLYQEQNLYTLLQTHLLENIVALILDIRGFVRTTKAGEQKKELGLKSVAEWLEKIFPRIIKIAFENQGLVGEFSGDRVMIVFGYPIPATTPDQFKENITHAVRTAIMIQELVIAIKNDNGIDPVLRNFDLGIGLCAGGPAWIGNLDNEWRQELIVISTVANIAARAEELTKNIELMSAINGMNIIVNQTIVDVFEQKIKEQKLKIGNLGPQKVRGLDRTYALYHIQQADPDLFSTTSTQSEEHTDFSRWLSDYLDGALERDNTTKLRHAFSQIGEAIINEQPEQVFERLMDEIRTLFDAQTATLYSIDWDSHELIFEKSSGTSAPDRGSRIPITGFAGATAVDRSSRLIDDLHSEPGWFKGIGNQGDQHSMMCVPLIAQEQTIGVIQVIDRKPSKYTEQDINMLEAFAGPAAMAIINARIASRYEHQLLNQKLLKVQNDITLALATLNMDDILNVIMHDAIQGVFRPRSATLYLVVDNELEFAKILSTSQPVQQLINKRLPIGSGIAGKVAQTGTPYISGNVHEDPEWLSDKDQNWLNTVGQESRSMVCVPMQVKGQVVGVIQVIDDRLNAFNVNHLDILNWLATSAAIAVDNAARYQELERTNQKLQETQARYVAAQTMAGLGHVVGELTHDLTNDIAAIRTNAKWLLKGRRQQTPEIVATKILSLTERTMNMIDRMREPLNMTVGVTNIRQVLEELKEETLLFLEQRESLDDNLTVDFNLELQTSSIVEGNDEKIKAIFRNLIRNSIRAIQRKGEPKGTITICELPSAVDKDKFVRIEVKDSGIGISEEAQKRIFDFGYTDKPEGHGGYGLFAVALTVQSLGGRVEVMGQEGVGAIFAVELPSVK